MQDGLAEGGRSAQTERLGQRVAGVVQGSGFAFRPLTPSPRDTTSSLP